MPGRLVAAAMNRGNRGLNDRAIELLDVHPSASVIDLGFGGGVSLPALLDRARAVVGVERSAHMLAAAARRHRSAVSSGRLTLLAGEVEDLPLGDQAVARVLSVNTVYFWRDLPKAFGELSRVLEPGGRLVLGIRDGAVMQQVTPDVFTLRTPSELEHALSAAGFTDVETRSARDGKTHLLRATVATTARR